MKNIVLFVILVILLVTVLMFGTLYSFDQKMMEDGKPVVFSTWGKKYSPVTADETDKIEIAINDHIITQRKMYSGNLDEKWFSAERIYLISKSDDEYIAYAWVYATSYIKKNDDELQENSGFSIPHKFTLKKENNKFTIIKEEFPRDGALYPIDMETLFPSKVLSEMDKIQNDGTIDELERDIQKQIAEYYN